MLWVFIGAGVTAWPGAPHRLKAGLPPRSRMVWIALSASRRYIDASNSFHGCDFRLDLGSGVQVWRKCASSLAGGYGNRIGHGPHVSPQIFQLGNSANELSTSLTDQFRGLFYEPFSRTLVSRTLGSRIPGSRIPKTRTALQVRKARLYHRLNNSPAPPQSTFLFGTESKEQH